jgi:hypothetical protein
VLEEPPENLEALEKREKRVQRAFLDHKVIK